MTDDAPPPPQNGVTYGAISTAYHLFGELALSVPPSSRLKTIRQIINFLRRARNHAGDADAQIGEEDIKGAADDLETLRVDLSVRSPTNWCDIVAKAEIAAFYAPGEHYDDEDCGKYRDVVFDLIRTIRRLSKGTEPECAGEEVDQAGPGCVYLVRSGQHFKIGRTNALETRMRALARQLPEKLIVIHHIKTDDPSGIETYWHRRFAKQRQNGEWFALSPDDVEVFTARAVM